MNSFAKSKGADIVNWEELLSAPSIDFNRLFYLASSWKTCPIGQESITIPRDIKTGLPDDLGLRRMGDKFSKSIHREDKDDALQVLLGIHKICRGT